MTPGSTVASGGVLARNVGWNFLGLVLPLALAVLTIPMVIRGLGMERFAILTLAWALIGYFGLFDLGLGRAIGKLTSEHLGRGTDREIPSMLGTALAALGVLGTMGSLALWASASWLASDAFKIDLAFQHETAHALRTLAFALPAVTLSSGLIEFLAAKQRFRAISVLRGALGAVNFGAPLVVLQFSHDLATIFLVLVWARWLACAVALVLCRSELATPFGELRPRGRHLGSLAAFGGWIAVSNFVGPLMVYLDRFLLGALVPMTLVAYYTIPYEVVTKLWVIPSALVGVLFPAFALSAVADPARTRRFYATALKCLGVALFPIGLVLCTYAHELLSIWLGQQFADQGARILQWLTIGVLINSIAWIPATLLQGIGRPDITARLHLIELPLYLVALWFLVREFSILGAAIGWAARAAIDACVLLYFANAKLALARSLAWRLLLPAGATVAIAIVGAMLTGPVTKGAFVLGCTVLLAFAAPRLFFGPEEVARLRSALTGRRVAQP